MKILKEQCQSLSDTELVAKTLADQDFYYCLVDRYEAPLKRYIARLSDVDPAEAEDVLQDIFLKAYLNLNGFDPDLKFSSWLYRLAHNQIISHYRKRRARRLDQAVPLDDWSELASAWSVAAELDSKLDRERLGHVLSRLEPKYREVLALKFLEDKDYREISDILEKPMGTIASLISRAKRQFRRLAEEENIRFKTYD